MVDIREETDEMLGRYLLSYSSNPQAPTSTFMSTPRLIRVIPGESENGSPEKSEIRCLEYDRHFNSTSGASFHSDHTNLCIGVVQIMTGESLEIICPCLRRVGGRDPMNKRIRKGSLSKAWCKVRSRRNVAKGVVFLIRLR